MLRAYHSQTADSGWINLADQLLNCNEVLHHDGRGGPTKELLHVGLSILDPRQRWVISRQPVLNPAFAIAEVIWILSGRNDAKFLNYFNNTLPKYAGNTEVYPGAYGYRLRKHFGLDQLERAFHALSSNKESRQVVLQIWDADTDLPHMDGSATSADIPCNVVSMLKVRNERLEWTQLMRSNDLYRGLPHNLIQFTMIQEIIAGWLGIEVGSYNHIADSLHIYNSDLEFVEQSKPLKVISSTDDLAIPLHHSESAIYELQQYIDAIISEEFTEQGLIELLMKNTLPAGFKNMFCVLCAESGRRRNFEELVERSMMECSNPLYEDLFSRWVLRLETLKQRV